MRITEKVSLFDAPWRVINELRRLFALPYIRLMCKVNGVEWGQNWRVFGMPMIQRYKGSKITLGARADLRSWRATNPLAPNHAVVLATRKRQAVIQIGDDCGLTGATLVAAERIEIGNRVLVGANATIVDTDFHPIDPDARRRDILNGRHRPVIIGDDVFIGMNSLILKGVTIGAGAVIGAGSVVTADVPPRAIVAGNPAKVVRML